MKRLVVGLLAVGVTACGIGSSESVDEIEPEELAGLSETPLASTSTILTATESTAPSALTVEAPPSMPPASAAVESTEHPSTSAPAAATTEPTDDVELYFIDGSQLVPSQIALTLPVSRRDHLEGLAIGPDSDDAEAGIRTAVPPGLVDGLLIKGNRITVDLDVDVLNTVESPDQLPMVGQIVLTLTGPMGFDEVRFTVDDRPTQVFLGDTSLSETDEWVTRSDYEELLDDARPASPSTVAVTSSP